MTSIKICKNCGYRTNSDNMLMIHKCKEVEKVEEIVEEVEEVEEFEEVELDFLDKMLKEDLVELAETKGIKIKSTDTKTQIIEKLKG